MSDARFEWPSHPHGWDLLVSGVSVTLVKRTHDGSDVVRYPGRVVASSAAPPWVEIEARWTAASVIQGSLVFETGDLLREFFSCNHPFNAFALYSPNHELKGWYANVTYPSWVEQHGDEIFVPWQDLWLDIVSGPDRISENLDDDELAASGLADRDPELHAAIISARNELVRRLTSHLDPFGESAFIG